MGELILRSDTKATEFGHLTSIDLELNSIIVELAYLSCLSLEYGSNASKLYQFEYGAEIISLEYDNPLDIFAYFKNVSKKSVDWLLARTLFYREERAKRQAEAEKKHAEAERIHQSVIEKKLKNLDTAHKLRQKMIKDGMKPEEASRVIADLLHDQRATLLLPDQKGTTLSR